MLYEDPLDPSIIEEPRQTKLMQREREALLRYKPTLID